MFMFIFFSTFLFCFKGYYDTLKIVLKNTCVENYQNKNSIISHIWISLFSPLSSDTQFYTKFFKLKSTNKNTIYILLHLFTFIYKIKSYFPQLCKALGIPLYCTFTKIRLLHIAKIKTWIKFFFYLEVLYIS